MRAAAGERVAYVTETIEIRPVRRPISGTVRPPGSKSLTNRALVVSALATGSSRLKGVLASRDTEVMVDSLGRLGVPVTAGAEHELHVAGCGGAIPVDNADLWLENSGTSIRFLAALCCLGKGTFRLDGNTRMRERPIGDLLSALEPLGVKTRCETNPGCPPIVIEARGMAGGATQLDVQKSSQFLSALLMAAPYAEQPVEIQLLGSLVSEPYIDMTLGVMARFGVTVDTSRNGRYRVPRQAYRGADYEIEPDASAASYFFAAAAVTGGEVSVSGLSEYSLQGDVRFVDALERMGCKVNWGPDRITLIGKPLKGIDVDMNAISDTAQTLAAVAPFAEGPTRIRNVAHMRHKETDRISAVAVELRRLGVAVEEHDDGLTIHPGPVSPGTVHTYDDHRMAMSFSVLGLKTPGIVIADPRCTSKTYPNFFDDWNQFCAAAW